jgi:queuine/archaeosine tRNA-ribosyltransferase
MTIHNLSFVINLTQQIRDSLKNNTLTRLKRSWLGR